MIIDGELMDGKRVKYLTKDSILAKEYVTQITGLNNWIDAHKGQIDGLKNELVAAKHELEHVRYDLLSQKLNARIDAYKGEIDGLKHELAAEKHELERVRYDLPPQKLNPQLASGVNLLNDVPRRYPINEFGRRVQRRIATVLGVLNDHDRFLVALRLAPCQFHHMS